MKNKFKILILLSIINNIVCTESQLWVTKFLQKQFQMPELILRIQGYELEEVQRLIRDGANVNEKDQDNNTPLYHALKHLNSCIPPFNNASHIAELLINNGADINERSGIVSVSPLMAAISNGYLGITQLLISKGAKFNIHQLIWALDTLEDRWSGSKSYKDKLVSYVNEIIEKFNDDLYKLVKASEDGEIKTAKEVLDSHKSTTSFINYSNYKNYSKHNRTPLIAAIIALDKAHGSFNPNEILQRQFEMIKFLLDQGADPNIKGIHGMTALMFAITIGFPKVVQILLEYKADPNIPDQFSETPLELAQRLYNTISTPYKNDYAEIIKMLKERL